MSKVAHLRSPCTFSCFGSTLLSDLKIYFSFSAYYASLKQISILPQKEADGCWAEEKNRTTLFCTGGTMAFTFLASVCSMHMCL